MKRIRPRWVAMSLVCYALVFVGSTGVGGLAYFHFADPLHTCASCHEMRGEHAAWLGSAHRTIHCRICHGGALTLDVHAVQSHLRRVTQHVRGRPETPIRLSEVDLRRAHAACRNCHPQTFAEWQESRHTTTFGRIFLDPDHNATHVLADDCLRCHGMFFAGEMRDLVTPLNQTGPWRLRDETRAAEPAIPCLACHQIHTPAEGTSPPHFYDRREGIHFAATRLPAAKIFSAHGDPVPVASDPRQRVCQQCHAPSAALAHRRGTGDDRTPTGVHAGLGCLDCHAMHSTSARNSCASCHPANSHCGLDVEKMDTTFASSASRHDIHALTCADCHPAGVPSAAAKMRPPAERSL